MTLFAVSSAASRSSTCPADSARKVETGIHRSPRLRMPRNSSRQGFKMRVVASARNVEEHLRSLPRVGTLLVLVLEAIGGGGGGAGRGRSRRPRARRR
jgi:hypothetical protein